MRQLIRLRGSLPIIPTRSNEKSVYPFDRERYRGRNVIERLIGRLKESRSIATRFCKKARNFLAMMQLGCLQIYLKLLESLRN